MVVEYLKKKYQQRNTIELVIAIDMNEIVLSIFQIIYHKESDDVHDAMTMGIIDIDRLSTYAISINRYTNTMK